MYSVAVYRVAVYSVAVYRVAVYSVAVSSAMHYVALHCNANSVVNYIFRPECDDCPVKDYWRVTGESWDDTSHHITQ